ncbi:hypothetical protein I7I51_07012 [Histoplasma capsulatum]|uniref:Uncharacterized protein n=1 Tax=Ajellomyces capsulatus TaxID=5037 RepID=A0A8A1MJT4_AJECA|nr:hypothetical protein I7I51_07012 [Histoplasma capsulatum]
MDGVDVMLMYEMLTSDLSLFVVPDTRIMSVCVWTKGNGFCIASAACGEQYCGLRTVYCVPPTPYSSLPLTIPAPSDPSSTSRHRRQRRKYGVICPPPPIGWLAVAFFCCCPE